MWKRRFTEENDDEQKDEIERTSAKLQTLRDSLASQRFHFREAVKVSNRIANSAFEVSCKKNKLSKRC